MTKAEPAKRAHSDAEARDKLCAFIQEIRIAMVATVETDGSLRARPMAGEFLGDDRATLYFLTGLSSHKAEEVMRDPRVCLTFARTGGKTGGDYVSVSGRARISRDPDLLRRLWHETQRPWFPRGVDDPEICAFCVDLDYGEYWDPPAPEMGLAYGWAKAVLTGESADGDLGDRRQVNDFR